MRSLDSIHFEQFDAAKGDNFQLSFNCRTIAVSLVDAVLHERGIAEGFEAFTLVFRGPEEALLASGTYTLTHDGIGSTAMFLAPVRKTREGILYEALFNRLVPA